MTKYVGAIDLGTTSTRFIIFDRAGATIASSQIETTQVYPQPGWVEQDALEVWRNTQTVITRALGDAGIVAADLAAVGITNQCATTVLWNRSGQPQHNALVWQDSRTADHVGEMARDGGPDRFRAVTGLPLAPIFSSQLLRWLLYNVPSAMSKARAGDLMFGTMDSWVAWNLTGQHITDVSNANYTQLMNLETLDWDPALLEAFEVPPAVLPRIGSSSAVHAKARGVLEGVPLGAMLGDISAALVGQVCFRPGEAKNTYGTAGILTMNTGTSPVPSKSGLFTSVAYRFGDSPACYCLVGPVGVAGSIVQWLRDNLKLIGSSSEIEALAASVPDNGDVYIVPAFSGLLAPHWRADARGIIVGLTQFANGGHIARAALESAAYQTHDVLAVMERESGFSMPELRVDGGMARNSLLMQFQSDILNVPVVQPRVLETTALGAAYAAGLAVGYWEGTDDLVRNWAEARRWHPTMDQAQRTKLMAAWEKAVPRSFGWTS